MEMTDADRRVQEARASCRIAIEDYGTAVEDWLEREIECWPAQEKANTAAETYARAAYQQGALAAVEELLAQEEDMNIYSIADPMGVPSVAIRKLRAAIESGVWPEKEAS